MRSSVRVVVITRDILRFTIAGLQAVRPTAIDPFRFCRQPIFPFVGEHSNFAVECDELRAVLICMVSVYRTHRCIRILPTIRQISTCDHFVLSLLDRRLLQPKIVHESDFTLTLLNGMTTLGLRAHSIIADAYARRAIRLFLDCPERIECSQIDRSVGDRW